MEASKIASIKLVENIKQINYNLNQVKFAFGRTNSVDENKGDGSSATRQSSVKKNISGKGNSQSKESYERQIKSQESALTNYLILKEIFEHLSYVDLLVCRKVNKLWASIYDSLKSSLCLYRIRLRAEGTRVEGQGVMYTKIIGNPSYEESFGFDALGVRISDSIHTDLDGLLEELQETGKNFIISIELDLTDFWWHMDRNYRTFFREFGDKVHVFGWVDSRHPVDNCILLLKYFPNLQVLKCGMVDETGPDQVPEDALVLPRVKRIYLNIQYTESRRPEICWLFARCCPNVQEIFYASVESMEFLGYLGKINKVKSLSYPGHGGAENIAKDGLAVEAAIKNLPQILQQLAQAPVTWDHLEIPDTRKYKVKNTDKKYDPGAKTELLTKLKGEIHRILQANPATIKTITIAPVDESIYYFPLPSPLKSVKTLIYNKLDYFTFYWQRPQKSQGKLTKLGKVQAEMSHVEFFQPGTDLKGTLPNLEELQVRGCIGKDDVALLFPPDILGPDIFHIKILKIRGAYPESFKGLMKCFPRLEHFEMESTVDHFPLVFPTIARSLLDLKTFTIFMEEENSFCFNSSKEKKSFLGRRSSPESTPHCENYYEWDSVLTGIPEFLCKKLNEPGETEDKTLQQKVMKAQDRSGSIFNMRYMMKLEFVVRGEPDKCIHCSEEHLPKVMSSVVVNQVLKKLPGLRIVLGLRGQFYNESYMEELRKTYSSLESGVDIAFNSMTPEIHNLCR